MDTQVKVVAYLNIIYGCLGILVGVFFAIVLGGVVSIVGFTTPDPAVPMGILTIVAIFLFSLFFLVSIPGVIGGLGILWNQEWGRILTIIVSVFNLLSIPIGTAVGLYSIIVLLSKDAQIYFHPQTPPPGPFQTPPSSSTQENHPN
jgi:hypothetical protein